MLVYFDDIVVVSSSDQVVDAFLHDLGLSFALKDLGELHSFLGIDVREALNSVVLFQEKYAHDLLAHVHVRSCKSVDTPFSVSEKLSFR
jgi:hypothetical protein